MHHSWHKWPWNVHGLLVSTETEAIYFIDDVVGQLQEIVYDSLSSTSWTVCQFDDVVICHQDSQCLKVHPAEAEGPKCLVHNQQCLDESSVAIQNPKSTIQNWTIRYIY